MGLIGPRNEESATREVYVDELEEAIGARSTGRITSFADFIGERP